LADRAIADIPVIQDIRVIQDTLDTPVTPGIAAISQEHARLKPWRLKLSEY
jgi:hypothetical protein